jgi:hypothetical protein
LHRYSEGDGVDDREALGADGIKYEGISANENEQLSVKQYSMEHLKQFCSDPVVVSTETPAGRCRLNPVESRVESDGFST